MHENGNMNQQFNYSIDVGGTLLNVATPKVMGILNVTPDSFYAGSRKQTDEQIAARVNQIVAEEGDIIDVGAYSTRPDANKVSPEEEMTRMRNALSVVRTQLPQAVLSVDTFRPEVARMAVEEFGVAIINDVSAGAPQGAFGGETSQAIVDNSYPVMFQTVARLGVAYILMSTQSDTNSMLMRFAHEVQQLRDLGQKDIIIDPGFGFGKTLEQNYAVLNQLDRLHTLQLPLLVGVSRKSMIWKSLDNTPDDALNGTTVLNTIALLKGANILRVHDVKQAIETIKICSTLG